MWTVAICVAPESTEHADARRKIALKEITLLPARQEGIRIQVFHRRSDRQTIPTGETGAGEGIRTLDPDLGKVVLYP
jgi:hypothetical protein